MEENKKPASVLNSAKVLLWISGILSLLFQGTIIVMSIAVGATAGYGEAFLFFVVGIADCFAAFKIGKKEEVGRIIGLFVTGFCAALYTFNFFKAQNIVELGFVAFNLMVFVLIYLSKKEM